MKEYEYKEGDFVYAPWTDDQVKSLNAYQTEGIGHDFTCGNTRHKKSFSLFAMNDGWHCMSPKCQYTQQWAWTWMANWSWKKAKEEWYKEMGITEGVQDGGSGN